MDFGLTGVVLLGQLGILLVNLSGNPQLN